MRRKLYRMDQSADAVWASLDDSLVQENGLTHQFFGSVMVIP